MALWIYESKGRHWIIDWEIVRSIVRSWARHRGMLQHGSFKKQEAFEINPITDLFLDAPIISTYEVDFEKLNEVVAKESKAVISLLRQEAKRPGGPEHLRDCLLGLAGQAESNREEYRKRMKRVNQATMKSIDNAVKEGQFAEDVARGIRDASATIVMIGAGVASGGTTWAAASGGSLLKAGFKYQDTYLATGNHGKAAASGVLEGTSELVMFMLPGSKSMKDFGRAEKVVYEGSVMLIGATLDGLKSLVSGKTINEALINGAASMATDIGLKGVDAAAKDKVVAFF